MLAHLIPSWRFLASKAAIASLAASLLVAAFTYAGVKSVTTSVNVAVGEQIYMSQQGSNIIFGVRLARGVTAQLWADNVCASPKNNAMVFTRSGKYTIPIRSIAGHGERFACALSSDGVLRASVPLPKMTTISGSMEGNLPVNPGDTIRAGYDFTMPGNHPAATITVKGAIAQMSVVCPDGSTQTLTISFPDQSYSVPLNNNSWIPSGDQNSSLVYQGSTKAPTNLCGGKQGHVPNGATFTANIQSTDTSDALSARFHYSDNSAGGWSATVSVPLR